MTPSPSARRSLRLAPLLLSALVLLGLISFPSTGEAQSGRYDVLVSSRTTNSVKRYDGETGLYLGDFVASGAGGLSATQEVLFAPDGHLIVSGRFNTAILEYDGRTGEFLGPFTSGYTLAEPTKMKYGPDGDLYVAQWNGSETVVRFDGQTGAFVAEVTPSLTDPMDPAWDADGVLHVAGFATSDVRRFDASGELDAVVIGEGLSGPVNLWFSGPDTMIVIDWQEGALKRFDADTGDLLDVYVSGLQRAEGWDIGPDGRLYVADWAAHVVNAYDIDTGVFEQTFIAGGGLSNPNSVLFFERLPDFDLTLGSGSLEVRPGAPGTTVAQVSPDRGLAYDEAITLGCTGLPAGVTCAFTPATIVPGADGVESTLTVTRTTPAGASLVPVGRPVRWGMPASIGWLGAVTLALMIGLSLHAPRTRVVRVLLLLALPTALTTCGGDGPTGVDDANRTVAAVTVTATSGAVVRSSALTLTLYDR